MSRRVMLGKLGSTNDYGLVISKPGVNVVDTSGNVADTDLLIFDSREKGYAQVIAKGTVTVTRTGSNAKSETVTFSSIPIPNPVVISYQGSATSDAYYEITSVSETAVQFTVPATYPDLGDIYGGFSYYQNFSSNAATPTSTVISYIVLRGFT